jgi:diguanylate cyclase (GGDEF)-like protein
MQEVKIAMRPARVVCDVDDRVSPAMTLRRPIESANLDLQERLLYLSYYDEVTGANSRRLGESLISAGIMRAKTRGTVVAVVMTNIENFSAINDRLGYLAGDQVLRTIVSRLKDCAGPDGSVIRVGGNRFCVVFTARDTDTNAREGIATVVDVFRRPVSACGVDLNLAGFVGCSLFPTDGADADALLRNAELALSEARRQRTPLWMFSADHGREIRTLAQIEADLQGAIEGGELELHYQPQVDGGSKRLHGVEALVRWHHKKLGWISPAVFVPIAERNGTILALGDWVVRTAVEQIAQWQRAGRAVVPVSINVSAEQLVQTDFYAEIVEVLRRGSVRPKLIKLELTETALIDDPDAAARVIRRLLDAGIETGMDDFGTGNSSLSLLASLPLSFLKIDKSFVDCVDKDDRSRRIVDASLGLARSLEMQVIAEGIERVEQAEWLLARSCTVMQGYYFSRPIAAAELAERWLASA